MAGAEIQRAGAASLIQLRAWLKRCALPENSRLPPERELCRELGITRGELRKSLAELEREGVLWRHVGKGTFMGERPHDTVMRLDEIERQTNPAEVMRMRLILEPALAWDAALHATRRDLEAMKHAIERSHAAVTWRQYEAQDNALHRAIGEASGNRIALAMFDALNTVRRGVAWDRKRGEEPCPPRDHHSFEEHQIIVVAIESRDRGAAQSAMLSHLKSVEQRLLNGQLGLPRRAPISTKTK